MNSNLQLANPIEQPSSVSRHESHNNARGQTSRKNCKEPRTCETLTFEEDFKPPPGAYTSRQIVIEDSCEEAGPSEPHWDHMKQAESWRDMAYSIPAQRCFEYYQRGRQAAKTERTIENNPETSALKTSSDEKSLQLKIRKLQRLLKQKHREGMGDPSAAAQRTIKPSKHLKCRQPVPIQETVPQRKIKISAGLQRCTSSRDLILKRFAASQARLDSKGSRTNQQSLPTKRQILPSRPDHRNTNPSSSHSNEKVRNSATPINIPKLHEHLSSHKKLPVKTTTPHDKPTTKKKPYNLCEPRLSFQSASQQGASSLEKGFKQTIKRTEKRILKVRRNLNPKDLLSLQNDLDLMQCYGEYRKLAIEIYERVVRSMKTKLARAEEARCHRSANLAAS